MSTQSLSPTPELAIERHYTVQEVSGMWGLSRQSVTRIFQGQPGVLRFGHGETLRGKPYFTIRIPHSVLARVHRDLRK